MSIPFDMQPVGEYPDVTVAQAYEALDDVFEELADLKAENLLLKAQVQQLESTNAVLQTQRDTANALANRRGW